MLTDLSNQLADAVAAAEPAVIQVQGHRRPASGVIIQEQVVLTTARVLGGEEGVRVRLPGGDAADAELLGWDPSSSLAVLRVPTATGRALSAATQQPRVGQLTLALGRSWSNAITASAGIVAVIGGPLRTGRRSAIEQVIRTTAPMHDGFAGGAVVDSSGHLLGIATASSIRGLGVVIPADIAMKTAAALLEHGTVKRGYLGIAGQRVALAGTERRTGAGTPDEALLVSAVSNGSPAAAAGMLVGDLVVEFDGVAVSDPEALLDLMAHGRAGRTVPVRILRGHDSVTLNVTVGERPTRT